MPDDLIEPKNPDAAAPVIEPNVPQEAAPAADQASGLSDDLLRLPAIQALMAGNPAAASGSLEEFAKRPEAKVITANKDALMNAGFFFYRSLDNALGVIGNGLYISPDQIKQADKDGTLAQVAPPFDQVSNAVSTAGDKNPVLAHSGKVPEGFATAPAPAGSPMPAGPTAPASTQNQLQTARLKNAAPGSPTSGPSPGAGRLANSIMKSPV